MTHASILIGRPKIWDTRQFFQGTLRVLRQYIHTNGFCLDFQLWATTPLSKNKSGVSEEARQPRLFIALCTYMLTILLLSLPPLFIRAAFQDPLEGGGGGGSLPRCGSGHAPGVPSKRGVLLWRGPRQVRLGLGRPVGWSGYLVLLVGNRVLSRKSCCPASRVVPTPPFLFLMGAFWAREGGR